MDTNLRYAKISARNQLFVTTSWDDGSASDIKLSILLKKYSLRATFYITKGYKFLERPLNPDEILELSKYNEIGAHTLSHPYLDRLDLTEARREIQGSKDYLEAILNKDILMFCYPCGRYNNNILNSVKECGFIASRTCRHASDQRTIDPFKWPITLHCSNGSPLLTLSICAINHLSIHSILDWESRAKELFDQALNKGGVYHLWGHASEIERSEDWAKLERVFQYISGKKGVRYMTNGEIIEFLYE